MEDWEANQSLLSHHDMNHDPPKKSNNRGKIISLWAVGILTTIYVITELALAIRAESLVLLSDGFHNLSDVVSIIIAYWAIIKSDSGASDKMSYGWKRTEVVGALINACSLLSLCLYIILEAIPRFIKPQEVLVDVAFLSIAGAGVGVNMFGTIVFFITGTHAHAHAHEEMAAPEEMEDEDLFNHHKKVKKHKHSHDHKHEHKHGHKHDHKHGHHQHGHINNDTDVHDGCDSDDGDDHHHHDHHAHDHDHNHDHDHDHEHDHHGHSHAGHSHSHDMNMWAVFIHYLGDAISSAFVLLTGLLIHFFKTRKWALYLDPISSVVIVAIMLYSSIPLVIQCANILMQKVPSHVNLPRVRKALCSIEHVTGLHDLHVWQLVDGMTISTVHLAITSPEHFESVSKQARKIFHKYNIHSSTIQPEYPVVLPDSDNKELNIMQNRSLALTQSCTQNCLPSCKEDWCCKETQVRTQRSIAYSPQTDPVFNPSLAASRPPTNDADHRNHDASSFV